MRNLLLVHLLISSSCWAIPKQNFSPPATPSASQSVSPMTAIVSPELCVWSSWSNCACNAGHGRQTRAVVLASQEANSIICPQKSEDRDCSNPHCVTASQSLPSSPSSSPSPNPSSSLSPSPASSLSPVPSPSVSPDPSSSPSPNPSFSLSPDPSSSPSPDPSSSLSPNPSSSLSRSPSSSLLPSPPPVTASPRSSSSLSPKAPTGPSPLPVPLPSSAPQADAGPSPLPGPSPSSTPQTNAGLLLNNATSQELINYVSIKYGHYNVGTVDSISAMLPEQRYALAHAITDTQVFVTANLTLVYVETSSQPEGLTLPLPGVDDVGRGNITIINWGEGVAKVVITILPPTSESHVAAKLVPPAIGHHELIWMLLLVDRMDNESNMVHQSPLNFTVTRLPGISGLTVYTHSCDGTCDSAIPGQSDANVTMTADSFLTFLSHTSAISATATQTSSGKICVWWALFAILAIIPIALIVWCMVRRLQKKHRTSAKAKGMAERSFASPSRPVSFDLEAPGHCNDVPKTPVGSPLDIPSHDIHQ